MKFDSFFPHRIEEKTDRESLFSLLIYASDFHVRYTQTT